MVLILRTVMLSNCCNVAAGTKRDLLTHFGLGHFSRCVACLYWQYVQEYICLFCTRTHCIGAKPQSYSMVNLDMFAYGTYIFIWYLQHSSFYSCNTLFLLYVIGFIDRKIEYIAEEHFVLISCQITKLRVL